MLVSNCKKCRLSEQRINIVNMKGCRKNPILFVGEAPGKEEDEQGRPFVGSAGRVLYSIIKEAGIDTADVAWTNVCRCRPPNNRTPETDEIAFCSLYLFQEIEELQPKFIVALGDTASYTLTGKKTNPYRGYVDFSQTLPCPVLITSHPSRTFHERAYYNIIKWDLNKLLWDWDTPSTESYIINPNSSVVDAWFAEAMLCPVVAVDIETRGKNEDDEDRGLNPRRDEIEGIGFCRRRGEALHLSGRHMEQNWERIKVFLESHQGLAYQNNRFDRAFLKVAGISSGCAWDTMTGMYLFNPDFPIRKLDFIRSLHTNIPPYKQAYWDGNSNIDLGRYNCLDVDVTLQGVEAQKEFVNPNLMKHMMNESDVALDMMLRGVYIDRDVLAHHWLDYQPKMEALAEEFYKEHGVEIGSNKQLSQLLYTKLGLSYQVKSMKKTMISVDDAALEYAKASLVGGKDLFPKEFETISHIQEYRECQKIVGTYCEGMFKLIQDDNRIHPWWKPEGTDTGRWACIAKGSLVETPGGRKPIEEVKAGDWLYCFDSDMNLAVKKAVRVACTGVKKVVRLHWIRNGNKEEGYLDLTPEHEVRLSSGEYKKAEELKENDRVAALSYGKDKDGYIKLYATGHKEMKAHTFVYDEVEIPHLPTLAIHHKDSNRENNDPSNLEEVNPSEHSKMHSYWMGTPEERERRSVRAKENHAKGIYKDVKKPERLALSKEECLALLNEAEGRLTYVPYDFATFKKYCKKWDIDVKAIRDRFKYRALYNHRITSAEVLDEPVEVWDIEVEEVGNFIVNEVCVHNCRNPNLQNIPVAMKDYIIPEPGKVLYYADFDRLEVWISALISGDEDLLEVLESGTDIHGVLQKEIAKEYPTITRVQAKTTLFGTFYGRGAKDIAMQFGVPVEIAKLWQDMIFGRFKKLGAMFRVLIPKEFEKNGFMTSFYGRVKYATKITEAMNFPIQSVASDTLNFALVALVKAGFHPILNQHDAVVCEEEDVSRWDEFLYIVQNSSPQLRLPIYASGGMGYNWQELTDDKMHEGIEYDLEKGFVRQDILEKYGISELAYDTMFKELEKKEEEDED